MNTNMIPNSKEGCLRRSMCFNSNALIRAKATPIPADAKNMRQNRLIPVRIASEGDIFGLFASRIDVVRTIAMASFKMLSPNTNMFKTGSISRA